MEKRNLQILAVVISLVLLTLLLASACTKQAPAPAPTTAPASVPTPTPAPAPTTAPAPAQTFELKFSDHSPPGGRMAKEVFGGWVKEMEELTNGRVKITIYGGGSLGGMTEQYDIALRRSADIASFDPSTMSGVFPRAEVITLPLFWKSNELSSMVFWDMMQKYMKDKDFKDVKMIWVHTTSPFQVFTKTKPVQTLEDFKSMKFGAITPMQAAVLKALRAVPVIMVPAEFYTALDRGLIDGRIFSWEGSIAFKMPEVTKYRTANVDMGTGSIIQIMNLETWNSLPPDIQKIIDEKGPEWSRQAGASFDEVMPVMIQNFADYDKQAGNPPIYYLPDSEKARWKEAVQPVIDAWVKEKEADGVPAKAMVEDLRALVEEYSK